MAPLSAHLCETGDHGRLGFHADCPVCVEERRFGALASEPVMSRRVQAAVTASALAVSLAAPSTVSAGEPGVQQQAVVVQDPPGTAPKGGSKGGAGDPVFDPGGDDTALPSEESPPGAPGTAPVNETGEDATLEVDIDYAAPVETSTESGTQPTNPEPLAVTPTNDGSDPSPSPPAAPGSPSPTTTTPGEQGAAQPDAPAPELTAERPNRRGDRRENDDQRNPRVGQPDKSGAPSVSHAPISTASPDTIQPAAETTPAVEVAPAAVVETTTSADSRPLPRGASFYVVKPGDSLWSVARRLRGPDASMARIAREVARLWELNQERIGTGDPDLLAVGTKLRLR